MQKNSYKSKKFGMSTTANIYSHIDSTSKKRRHRRLGSCWGEEMRKGWTVIGSALNRINQINLSYQKSFHLGNVSLATFHHICYCISKNSTIFHTQILCSCGISWQNDNLHNTKWRRIAYLKDYRVHPICKAYAYTYSHLH